MKPLKMFGWLIVVGMVLSTQRNLAQSSKNTTLLMAKEAITTSNAIYFESFVKNDPSLFADRYAADCCIMPPNSPSLCGAGAAAQFFEIAYSMGVRNGRFITEEVYDTNGKFVVEKGLWELYDQDQRTLDNGKYLVLWKKTESGWKMFRDAFSSDREVQ